MGIAICGPLHLALIEIDAHLGEHLSRLIKPDIAWW
jgi:hypothetical protein